MNEYKATETYPTDDGKLSIFLAGTIDDGASDDWQEELTKRLMPYDLNIFNPRRDDWNPDATEEELREQINWELDALKNAMLIIMYFAPNSKSPINLLELGLHADYPIVVCCPEGYWRKTNVEVVCERYGIPITDDKDKFFDRVVGFIEQETKEDEPEVVEEDKPKDPPEEKEIDEKEKKEKASN